MTAPSPEELWVLSYYRASELSGALLFGRLARRTEDPELRVFLTRHFADEARHAWLWTDTILRVGGMPEQIDDTYQSEYAKELGLPSSMAEVLLLTEVFENRIFEHFSLHYERTEQPEIRSTLRTMLDDEQNHLGWIEERLERYSAEGYDVNEMKERFVAIDRAIYDRIRDREETLWKFLGWSEEKRRIHS